MPLSLPEKRFAPLPPSSFSPHLFPTSYSVRDFRHLQFCHRGKVWVSMSVLPLALSWPSLRFSTSSLPFFLATDSFTVSDFESFPSSSRSSMLSSPAVGFARVCLLLALLVSACCWLSCHPAFCFALVVPVFGYALSVLLIFPCCWVCSSRGHRTRVASFLPLTTGSLLVVLSLIPPASLCGSLRLRGSLLASSNTTTQHCATS